MPNISQIFSSIKKKFNKDKKVLLPEYSDTIDPSIRELVNYCNNNGIETIASCSGVLKEHDGENENLYGQLNMMDSKIARKIAAYFIDSKLATVSLFSKPFEGKELYGNKIDDGCINLSFKNVNNETLPDIDNAIRGIVEKRITVDKKKLNYINNIFKFFNFIKSPMNTAYQFNDINYDKNKDTLEFQTFYIKPKCVDINKLTKMIGETTGLEYFNTDMDKTLDRNEIIINSQNREHELPKLLKISKKLERKADIIENLYDESLEYYEDYDDIDDEYKSGFFEDLYDNVTDEDAFYNCYTEDNSKDKKDKDVYLPDDLS